MTAPQPAGAPGSLQRTYSPQGICFGCGPANAKGLRIDSVPEGDAVVCAFDPEPHHQAFEGMVNGGILGAVLDCHMNWTAAHHLMVRDGLDAPPCTVTARFAVELRRPTPSAERLHVVARAVRSEGAKVWVEAECTSAGKVTVRGDGLFVAVGPDHPAYHRW